MAEPRIPSATSDRTNRLTPEGALELGMILGTVFHRVGVAIDADQSTVPVSNAFMAGLTAAGADVRYAGICVTPAACLALRSNCDCITTLGCPNTSGNVCLNLYHPDGSEFTSVDRRVFETEVNLPEWNGIGRVTENHNANDAYIRYIRNSGMRLSGYVVLDCGGGGTSTIAPYALSELGADVSSMDADNRLKKPRNPGLIKSELLPLSNFVDASTGSVGIAYNGDGTALAVCDEAGKQVTGEKLLSLLLMYLEPRTAVIPFNSPAIVEDAFRNPLGLRENGHGNDPDRTVIRAVTDEAIIEAAKTANADFVALNDGRFIFPELSLCPDAIYASAIIAEVSGLRSLRNILEALPTYISKRTTVPFNTMPRVFDTRLVEISSYYHVKSLDREDRAWKLIMDTGICTLVLTKDDFKEELNIYAESVDQMYLTTMVEQVLELIKQCN